MQNAMPLVGHRSLSGLLCFPWLFLQSKRKQGHCASLQGQSSQLLHADLLEALSSLTAAERETASRCRL